MACANCCIRASMAAWARDPGRGRRHRGALGAGLARPREEPEQRMPAKAGVVQACLNHPGGGETVQAEYLDPGDFLAIARVLADRDDRAYDAPCRLVPQ